MIPNVVRRQTLIVDDARHSLLRRAHALSQSSLEVFGRDEPPALRSLLPPDEYGTYVVREVEVETALTRCQVPGEPWSLNPYVGCSHACTYCYVPDVAHLERPRWGSYVIVKRNLPEVLGRELRQKECRPVFLSSATDPYQPVEHTHRITRRCLERLAQVDWPLRILTRSPSVQRDIDLFGRFSDVQVGMSVPTLDDEARAVVEGAAPPIQGRLAALRRLADLGLKTYVNLLPLYPLTGGVTAEHMAQTFADAGVRVVHAGGWNYLPAILPPLRRRLEGTPFEPFAHLVRDPAFLLRLTNELSAAFARRGVLFKS